MDEFQQLVYARLQSLPKGYMTSIGDANAIIKEEALEHIHANDKIGKTIIQINRNYFNLLKSGDFYKALSEQH